MTGYAERRDGLARSLREAGAAGPLRLDKRTSNLFRDRAAAPAAGSTWAASITFSRSTPRPAGSTRRR